MPARPRAPIGFVRARRPVTLAAQPVGDHFLGIVLRRFEVSTVPVEYPQLGRPVGHRFVMGRSARRTPPVALLAHTVHWLQAASVASVDRRSVPSARLEAVREARAVCRAVLT